MIIAIDPGKNKCGLALLDPGGLVIWQKIVPTELLGSQLAEYQATTIVVGNGAEGKKLVKQLNLSGIIYVSEYNSTLEARKLYWQNHPPQGFWRLIPTSLRLPPVPVDDYAAAILGKRYLNGF